MMLTWQAEVNLIKILIYLFRSLFYYPFNTFKLIGVRYCRVTFGSLDGVILIPFWQTIDVPSNSSFLVAAGDVLGFYYPEDGSPKANVALDLQGKYNAEWFCFKLVLLSVVLTKKSGINCII